VIEFGAKVRFLSFSPPLSFSQIEFYKPPAGFQPRFLITKFLHDYDKILRGYANVVDIFPALRYLVAPI